MKERIETEINVKDIKQNICEEMLESLSNQLLSKWYPLVIDNEFGGYFTNISSDFKLMSAQDKMIVTQARHIWTTAKAAEFFNNDEFINYSNHGFDFLINKMWDEKYGGYFQARNRIGKFTDIEGWEEEKRTYGNAFAVYGLAALYKITMNPKVLEFAKKSFGWIERHSFDPIQQGYYQFLKREGIPFGLNDEYKTKATDAVEVGFKDQNSSIHLLEAYTELYQVWKDEHVKKQLLGLLNLIRDIITHPKGYLRLFFEEDWTPISFREADKETRDANYRLDHVSFGHDYETAFLMLEASHALGIENDIETLSVAKRMVDHAIENGWDKNSAGFFDEGYYFTKDGKCEIIRDTKNWWAQAEGLNALLLFSRIFPEEEKYFEMFVQLWEYVKKYLIDQENGDWYWGSLEKEPFYKTGPKGSIWKGTYHNGRALMNCIKMLSDEDFALYQSNPKFRKLKSEQDEFITHWQLLAQRI